MYIALSNSLHHVLFLVPLDFLTILPSSLYSRPFESCNRDIEDQRPKKCRLKGWKEEGVILTDAEAGRNDRMRRNSSLNMEELSRPRH